MHKYDLALVALLAAAALGPPGLWAQGPQQRSTQAKPSPASAPSHDLNGMWEFFNGVPNQGIYATPSKDAPPMTPWAQARWDAAKPGYGPKAQAGGNDPILKCDPTGIPRILFFPQPFEVVMTPERTFMFFERDHAFRQIWTDGRDHPKDLEPTWMGDSTGKWDGETFVVDSIGFNDRAWLDFYGHPRSEQLHLVERYRRVDQNTLLLNFTVEDPTAYTKTWASDTKVYKLLPKKQAVMEELFCIPEEEDAFTNRIRMPAVGQTPSK